MKPLRPIAAALIAALALPSTALAANEPAGGAELGEIIGATAGATVLTTLLLALGLGHRSGRVRLLERAAGAVERITGLPGWTSLPIFLSTTSLLIALFGMYWDISLHVDVGRDAGPLANPAHYFILSGLFGIFSAGFLAVVLPKSDPGPTSVKITSDWRAPLGGVLIVACGAFSLIGFPLDDVWHRLFGQDVTLWGPTHLMLIGGAAMTLVGMAVLLVEGRRARPAGANRSGTRRRIDWFRGISLTGGFMIGLSTFQAEFDFGVPQFRFLFQPMLIMLAAGVGLVATRLWLGRGAALGAVLFFIAVRGGLAVLVGPVLGEATPHLPLYIVEALVVEAVALRVATTRPLAFGLWSGLGIGTIGLTAEWGWSHLWMPLPWPAELLPEGVIVGFAAAMAGALLGAWIGARLASDRIPRTRPLRVAAVAGAAVVALLVGFGLATSPQSGVSAQVALEDAAGGGPGRTVNATVKLYPPDAGDDADWLTATAWQGGAPLIVNRLERVGPGTYRTTEPIPVDGTWKALLRLHEGASLTGVPIFLPEDRPIPAAEVPAEPRFERTFVADHTILQREQKAASAVLAPLGYAVVVAIALGLLALLVLGLHRLAVAPECAAAVSRPVTRDPGVPVNRLAGREHAPTGAERGLVTPGRRA